VIKANTLQWSEGVYETSERDITGFTTHTHDGTTTLLKIGNRAEGCPALFEVSKYETYVVTCTAFDEELEQTCVTLDEALDKIDEWNQAGAELNVLGLVEITLNEPIQWEEMSDGSKSVTRTNYYMNANQTNGVLSISLQGQIMFFRTVTGNDQDDVVQQLTDLMNQKRYEVTQLVEGLR
jgi:hypothetical protein